MAPFFEGFANWPLHCINGAGTGHRDLALNLRGDRNSDNRQVFVGEGGQIMVNGTKVEQYERGDQKRAEESDQVILPYGPGWLILALGLACGIGFLGSSAFLRNYGLTGGELRLILMLLFFPVEWGGALLILAFLGDLERAVEKRRSRVPADPRSDGR